MRFVEGEGAHLEDLIAGVTPTFSGWTADPTDAADITDGDPTTFCTTGNKVATAYQPARFDWDLGGFYNIMCSGVGTCAATAGTPIGIIYLWNGSAWIAAKTYLWSSAAMTVFPVFGDMTSKVRVAMQSSADATITPNIREFHAWRL